jgi:hypothetical protein
MGLDQYAYAVKEDRTPEQTERGEGQEEISYWRKHNRLQGWMRNLYHEKGGQEEFNCEDVILTLEDLDELEKAINDKELPETGGFFFGGDSYDEYEEFRKDEDMDFIEKARGVIANGEMVVYSSWW